uniref:Uncharacterized protein n=1 Tax=Oryza brachyantha TaxID=4533 RepID=J3KVH1_ORYBR
MAWQSCHAIVSGMAVLPRYCQWRGKTMLPRYRQWCGIPEAQLVSDGTPQLVLELEKLAKIVSSSRWASTGER